MHTMGAAAATFALIVCVQAPFHRMAALAGDEFTAGHHKPLSLHWGKVSEAGLLARLSLFFKDFQYFLRNFGKIPLLFGPCCVYKYRSRDYVLLLRWLWAFYTSSPSSERPTPQGRPFSLTPPETQRKKSLTVLTDRWKSVKLLNWTAKSLCVGFEAPIP